tara:strand:+ start:233 stop:628 length:396 start_codon:yes stop_codon:yes gene_type:complete
MNLSRLSVAYVVGSLAAAAAVATKFALVEIFSKWAFLSSPDLEDFYEPMLWGGVAGLLFLLPIKISYFWRGILYGLGLALFILFRSPAWEAYNITGQPVFDYLTRDASLTTFALYIGIWGMITAMSLRKAD